MDRVSEFGYSPDTIQYWVNVNRKNTEWREALYKKIRDMRDFWQTDDPVDGEEVTDDLDAILREFWPGTVTGGAV